MTNYLLRGDLIERGWTDALIAQFLKNPDETKSNPKYASAAPMKLYLKSRVKKIESSETFAAAKKKAGKRKVAADKAVATRRAGTLAAAEAVEIRPLPQLDRNELVRRACAHYDAQAADRASERGGEPDTASPDAAPAFLDRICVNYLRHQLTGYDTALDELAGRTGFGAACDRIRDKVIERIIEGYPWLAGECARQDRVRTTQLRA